MLNKNKLISEVDKWLRKFLLRNSQRDEFGRIHCPITNKWLKEDNLHVCHIVDRARMITRFNPLNVFLGSKDSNLFEAKTFDGNGESLHHQKIEKFMGVESIDYLKCLSKKNIIYSREELEDLIMFFKG